MVLKIDTLLYFRGKYCTFYSTVFIWQLWLLCRFRLVIQIYHTIIYTGISSHLKYHTSYCILHYIYCPSYSVSVQNVQVSAPQRLLLKTENSSSNFTIPRNVDYSQVSEICVYFSL